MVPDRRPARILVVDDSAVVRSLLRSAILSDSALELAGTATDGASALEMLDSLRPDLILLDVEMPVLDGLATLRRLRESGHRTPVMMCSSLTQRGAHITIDALACGASDYVAKPRAASGSNLDTFVQELLRKIRALILPDIDRLAHDLPHEPTASSLQSISAVPSIVVIGVSTGGPSALHTLLHCLPAGFPLPVLIVQHMPDLFTRALAERLARTCLLPVAEAAGGDAVLPGKILIARGNWHMEVFASNRIGTPARLQLTQSPPVNYCRPSVDVLFQSAAHAYGPGVLAAILTGMGADGLAGARAVRQHDGTVLAQDEATSVVWGMPGAVVQARLAQRILPIQLIGPEIVRLASRPFASGGNRSEKVAL